MTARYIDRNVKALLNLCTRNHFTFLSLFKAAALQVDLPGPQNSLNESEMLNAQKNVDTNPFLFFHDRSDR